MTVLLASFVACLFIVCFIAGDVNGAIVAFVESRPRTPRAAPHRDGNVNSNIATVTEGLTTDELGQRVVDIDDRSPTHVCLVPRPQSASPSTPCIGDLVVRGPDWQWGDLDGGAGSQGLVYATEDDRYVVAWRAGMGMRCGWVMWDCLLTSFIARS